MTLSQFFEHYNLHDSIAEHLRFVSEQQLLTMNLELSNYRQRSFRQGDPEIVRGELTFSGVDGMKADPDLSIFRLETDAEILRAGLISVGSAALTTVKMVLAATDYKTRHTQTFVLEFRASDVEWKPDSVSTQ